jgi:hypothetical protein
MHLLACLIDDVLACRRAAFVVQYAPPIAAAGYNDLFGLFIWPLTTPASWRNVAMLPGTALPVSIANVNPQSNTFYVSNPWCEALCHCPEPLPLHQLLPTTSAAPVWSCFDMAHAAGPLAD